MCNMFCVCDYVPMCMRMCVSHLFMPSLFHFSRSSRLCVCNLSNSAFHVFFFFFFLIAVVIVVFIIIPNWQREKKTSWVQLIGTELMALKSMNIEHKLANNTSNSKTFTGLLDICYCSTVAAIFCDFLLFLFCFRARSICLLIDTQAHIHMSELSICLHISANFQQTTHSK